MRIRNLLIAVAVLAIAIPGIASAGSAYDRVTGGGQIFFNFSTGESEPVEGAGDTIAFTARETSEGVKGQVQIVERSGGTGQGQLKLHGTVTCLVVVNPTTARLAGTATRTDSDQRQNFEMLVTDNGEGVNAAADQIALAFVTTPECDDDGEDDDNQTTLARGNVQVYQAAE